MEDPVIDGPFLDKWGFDVETIYKWSLKFYKEKEGKAVHLSYQEKCELVAYTQQVSHGKFNPEVHGNVGGLYLDLVGKDRKLAWQKLGDMSKEMAMISFVTRLDLLCPLFGPYVEAQKKDVEMRAQRQREEEERRILEEEKRKLEEEEELKRKIELAEQEEKRRQIKEALNSQTYEQFKSYAEQQYPNNPDQQAILIRQLQEQHYIQYMQQIFQQQILSQNSTPEKTEETSDLPLDIEAAALKALADVSNFPVDQDQYSEGSGQEQEESPEVVPASMWTRKDIRDFKESIRKEGKDSIIKVGHGETVTVRVPTHEDGSCLFWEFATDSYDIGFGLFFEWTKSPTEQVSVHISDSEDEDEEEEPENETDDVELGGHSTPKYAVDGKPPISIIIPVYRRDCQEEVYAGSHYYPGQGVYLLKFDNSYSLWRSKTLYYRVYYTR